MEYDRIWRFRNFPSSDIYSSKGPPYVDERTGERCRVVVMSHGKGPQNALVEFADGTRYVVPKIAVRFGMRKVG